MTAKCGVNGKAIRVIGHRGAAGLWPENTLGGIQRAAALGVDGVEFDIHATRDGRAVLLHDGTLERTTGAAGLVAGMTLAELRDLDAGDGEPVPELGQVLDAVGRRCRLLCEIKAGAAVAPAVEAVAERGLQDQVTFISFSLDHLLRVRRLGDGMRIGALVTTLTPASLAAALDLGVCYIGVHESSAGQEDFQRIAERGVAPGAWTPNTLEKMLDMVKMGATHVTTDRPDLLLQHYGRAAGGDREVVRGRRPARVGHDVSCEVADRGAGEG